MRVRLSLTALLALVLLVILAVWLLDRHRRDGMYSTEGEFLARDELLTVNRG